LEDCTVIVQTNEHFVVVLPETTQEDLPFVLDRLRKQAADQVGIKLKIGTASLPEDSLTFEGLIEKATMCMHADLEIQQFIELEEKSLEHHLS
jgi:GGDEF domain-containing protein